MIDLKEITKTNQKEVAGRLGFEPRQADPESAVLPLHHLPKGIVLYQKS